MEGSGDYSLCILCCFSFPPSDRNGRGDDLKKVKRVDGFIRETGVIELKGLSCAGLLEAKDLSLCGDCLKGMDKASGMRERVEEVEVKVRKLQEEILRLLKKLKVLMDGYLGEMRGIEEKIRCSDVGCLKARFVGRRGRLKKGTWSRENIFQFREGILNVVHEQYGFREELSSKIISLPGHASQRLVESEPQTRKLIVRVKPEVENSEEGEALDDYLDNNYSPPPEPESEDGDHSSDNDFILPSESPRKSLKRKRTSNLRSSSVQTNSDSDSDSDDNPPNEYTLKVQPVAAQLHSKARPSWVTVIRKTFKNNKKTSARVFSCLECPDFSARDQYHFEQHMRFHEASYPDTEKNLECSQCQFKAGHQQYFDFHLLCHKSVFKGVCDQCYKSFNPFDLKAHLELDHGVQRIYQCTCCIQVQSTQLRFLRHMDKHLGIYTVDCGLCQKQSLDKRFLHRHLQEAHPEDDQVKHIYNRGQVLGKPGRKPGTKLVKTETGTETEAQPATKVLIRSLRRDKPSWYSEIRVPDEKPSVTREFKCTSCTFTFDNLYIFEQHLKFHEDSATPGPEIFRCSECPSFFKCQQYLEYHLSLHQGIFQQFCDICSKRFNVFKLKDHYEKEHQVTNLFSCGSCLHSVSKLGKYLNHVSCHSGPGSRITCHLCPEIVSDKPSLLTHYQVAHENLVPLPEEEEENENEEITDPYLYDDNPAAKPPKTCKAPKPQSEIRTQRSFRNKKLPSWYHYKRTRRGGNGHSDIRFYCNLCPEVCLFNMYRMEQHLRIHETKISPQDQKFQCTQCPAKFGVEQHLELHQCYHQKVFKMVCDICRSPKPVFELKAHMEQDHGVENVIHCSSCSMVRSTRFKYLDHLGLHPTEDVIITCDICQQSCKTKRDLMQHWEEVHGVVVEESNFILKRREKNRNYRKNKPRNIICAECGKAFTSTHILKLHQAHVHNKEDHRPWKCTECPSAFKSKPNLHEHMDIHKRAGSGPQFQCHLCTKSFYTKDSFEGHMRKHDGTGYPCELCGMMFGQTEVLKAHMKTHTRVWFHCDKCDAKYARQWMLDGHMKAHEKKTENRCTWCNKIFLKPYYLRQHMASVHSKERNNKCSYCGKAFGLESNLKGHMRKMHPVEWEATKRSYTKKQVTPGKEEDDPQQGEVDLQNSEKQEQHHQFFEPSASSSSSTSNFPGTMQQQQFKNEFFNL